MSKAIELAEEVVTLWDNGLIDRDDLEECAAELRRLAAVEKQLEAAQAESVRLAAQLAEEKLRADRMTEQHRMQASISAAAQAELAAIRALEPVAWRFPKAGSNNGYNYTETMEGEEPRFIPAWTPLYALPEQK